MSTKAHRGDNNERRQTTSQPEDPRPHLRLQGRLPLLEADHQPQQVRRAMQQFIDELSPERLIESQTS